MDPMMDDGDHLEHHGVPGMRWGVRKNRENQTFNTSLQKPSAKTQKIVSKIRKKINQLKSEQAYVRNQKKKIKNIAKRRYTMSDQELNKYINRLDKQKKLNELSKAELNPGRNAVKKTLKKYGGKSAGIVVATGTAYALKKHLV